MWSPEAFLDRSREGTHAMHAKIEAFAERVGLLRTRLGEGREQDGDGADGHAARQAADELGLGIEELRAQRDALIEAQGNLERERAKYLDLFLHAPDAYVTTDARGLILDANEPAASLLALPRAGLAGKLLIGFVARGDTRHFRERLRDVEAETGTGVFEVRLRPRGRSPLRVALSVSSVRGARQERIAFRWTLRAAEKGESARGDAQGLLRLFVDQLRKPLTSILGWSRMLRAGELPAGEERHAIEVLAEAAREQERSLGRLHEFLLLAEIAEQAVPLELSSLVCDAARRCAGRRLLTLECDVPAPLHVAARRDALVWALDCLFDAAFDRVPGGGSVRVTGSVDGSRASVQVSTKDTAAVCERFGTALAVAAIRGEGGEVELFQAEAGEEPDPHLLEMRMPLL
ncbi:MAG TPA: PAS domain-containing protein [Polyangiaceae bacterium]